MPELVWLVTGCSSGFGQTFVEAILAKGDKVIATARGDVKTRLADLEKKGAAIMELDVTQPAHVLDAKVAEAVKIYGRIDVLLNNAGNCELGCLEEIQQDLVLNAYQLHVFGPLSLTRAVLPYMRERRTGTVLFHCSVMPYFPLPGGGVYASCKAAVETYVATLSQELSSFNVRACALVTGFFRTAIMSAERSNYARTAQYQEYDLIAEMTASSFNDINGHQPGDPVKASKIVVDVVHGDGVAAGRPFPIRLPLGSDAMQFVEGDTAARLKEMRSWAEVTSLTDFDK